MRSIRSVHYTIAWHRPHVLLVGYSFGADVAPFLVNRLPAGVRNAVTALAVLGPSMEASFEFHVKNWLVADGDPRYPVRPELERTAVPVTCISGSEEEDSACRGITSAHVKIAELGRGHHFSGEYGELVDLILR